RDVTVNDTIFTEPVEYRNKAVFHYGKGKFGYFSEKTNEVTDILPCPLLPSRFNGIGAFVNTLLPTVGGIGFRSLYLRTTVDGDISVVFDLEGKGDKDRLMKSSVIPQLVGEFPEITGILASVGESVSILYGERELTDELSGLRFIVSPEGFWQVNHTAAEKMADVVLRYAAEAEFDTCIDLYCGSGTFGLILAHRFPDKEYYGVELNPKSIEDAKRNGAANGVENITFFCGDAADFGKSIDTAALGRTLAVIDPPRAGCSPEMLRNLAELGAERVIYISCSPNTLARDCAKLAEMGYTVDEVTPVNMFPRTKHCESVALLSRKSTTHQL
ncbi:MAG: 23S rRNA (uracil(1939)-C(5))-methyltransferase RlmD, partial [Ruminococcaceae bacterium]|nr:23S rRNA (uracil(1939)-C(5))-methyltransferase RlmD [Oscillospiraceae bacterium]